MARGGVPARRRPGIPRSWPREFPASGRRSLRHCRAAAGHARRFSAGAVPPLPQACRGRPPPMQAGWLRDYERPTREDLRSFPGPRARAGAALEARFPTGSAPGRAKPRRPALELLVHPACRVGPRVRFQLLRPNCGAPSGHAGPRPVLAEVVGTARAGVPGQRPRVPSLQTSNQAPAFARASATMARLVASASTR